MRFSNEFIVPAAPAQAWALLTDVPKIAPCLPGATVESTADGHYDGSVTVKAGPIKVSYRGTASFIKLDEHEHRMVLDARGKESNGKGSATAVVTVCLREGGAGKTVVQVSTELQITGKIAQFGRSAMADISTRLIGQFADNLGAMLSDDGAGNALSAGYQADQPVLQSATNGTTHAGSNELDALTLAGPVIKRAAPAVIAFLLGVLISRFAGHSSARSRNPRGRATRAVLL